ncbi:MAG: gamma-glutamyltransferase [bacterium]
MNALILIIAILCLNQALHALPSYNKAKNPIGRRHMVSSQDPLASKTGMDILHQGGNAIDAAIAVAYSLAVTHPQAGNLGGGGFMLIYIKKENKVYALDYREKAPKAAWKDMFIGENGEVSKTLSQDSLWATGVPGTVAGLDFAWKTFGTLPLQTCLAPAITLAKEGFPVSRQLHNHLDIAKDDFLQRNNGSLAFYPNNQTIATGSILVQPELAQSIQWIANDGPKAFYQGPIAAKLIDFMQKNRGLITREDLLQYRPKFREPVSANYRGYHIYSMPPPSSGGIHLIQLLKMVEGFPINDWGYQHPKTLQLFAEAMSLVYQDRATYLGDPDFVSIPQRQLLSPSRIKQQQQQLQQILSQTKRPHPRPAPPNIPLYESNDTTHFSIIDSDGNMVSNTYTLNFRFGNKIMIPGTGILLNNEMDDFSAKPGAANAYGLIGSHANAIAPEKRMLSSMTPTLVFKDNQPWLATGSPGGSRIITIVFQTLINLIDYNMNLIEASTVPRMHYQWQPDTLYLEKDFDPQTKKNLTDKGYLLKPNPKIGSIQSVLRIEDVTIGVSDPRTSTSN